MQFVQSMILSTASLPTAMMSFLLVSPMNLPHPAPYGRGPQQPADPNEDLRPQRYGRYGVPDSLKSPRRR
jgi:hypothetical protein